MTPKILELLSGFDVANKLYSFVPPADFAALNEANQELLLKNLWEIHHQVQTIAGLSWRQFVKLTPEESRLLLANDRNRFYTATLNTVSSTVTSVANQYPKSAALISGIMFLYAVRKISSESSQIEAPFTTPKPRPETASKETAEDTALRGWDVVSPLEVPVPQCGA